MMLDDIAAFLEAEGVGVVGTDIFKAIHPDTAPETSMTIYEYAGRPPMDQFGEDDVPSIERPGLQVIARSPNYQDARNFLQDAYNALCKIANEVLGTTLYERVQPVQSPFPMGRDANSRALVTVNFSVWKDPS